jgi:phage replication-related protein YjqB (UPF0714/DUF867 family)
MASRYLMKDDKYCNFLDLAGNEVRDVDYCVRARSAGSILILAPHGGGIELGTSELAKAVAADDHSLYLFEGLKVAGNHNLHITSSNFDEPICRAMLKQANRVVTVHGEERVDAVVFIGGLDEVGIERMSASLTSSDFAVERPDKSHLKGHAQTNICNRGRSGAGVQLEITEGLRRMFFRALSPRSERQHTTSEFVRFVDAVREALV